MSKTCPDCGETKATTEYNKKASMKDGLRAKCKSCTNAHRKAYREANKENLAADRKIYREVNKERILAREKAYREANKEKINANREAWYEANKERIRARRRRRHHDRCSNSPCVIYSIFCIPEQRYYIGQTIYAPKRWGEHKREFKSNNNKCGRDREMQNDYNKHGQESFEYTILKELPADANKETRLEEEKNHILQFLKEGKSLYNFINTTE